MHETSLSFRTSRPNRILLYTSDEQLINSNSIEIVDNGRIKFKFQCVNETQTFESKKRYDDSNWNDIVILKNASTLEINVNENLKNSENFTINCINEGLIKDATSEMNMQNISSYCVRPNVKEEIQKLPENAIMSCSDHKEDGIFFSKNSFAKLREVFNVSDYGDTFKITMEIKPRSLTGLLISAHGDNSFFVVEMVDGNIHFTVDSGDGPRETVLRADKDNSLCDGEWHTGKLNIYSK